jgi:uncharacterized protein
MDAVRVLYDAHEMEPSSSERTGEPVTLGKTWPFFLVAFCITWGCQVPGLLAHLGLVGGPEVRFLPLVGLGSLGPLLAGVLWSSRRCGGEGNRALFGRLFVPKVAVGFYLLAPLVSGALLALGLAAYGLFTRADVGPWIYPPRAPERLFAMVMFSVGEEVGWRGYALPRLRERYGALPASLLLGLLWGLWHIPMFLMVDLDLATAILLVLVFMPAGSVVFGWFFEKTRGSLTIAILLHMGAHLNNSHAALPRNCLPAYVHTAAYVLFATLLVVADRARWRRPNTS